MKQLFTLILIFTLSKANSQSLYFPPISGTAWDTMAPASLGWCQPAIDSLYSYLQQTNTDAFIVLKNGKIVLEKYFGTFTADSTHYWASAGKSLIAMLTGIAQDKGLLNINNPVSNYLGNGWSAAPLAKENAITTRNLLSMNSGFDETPPPPCSNDDITPACLQYFTDTGQRWAYHTGAYQQIAKIITTTSGMGINPFTNTNLGVRTGITGLWANGVFFSKPRNMARFGLLALAKGVWAGDSVLRNTAYFNSMVNTSQPLNLSYGYLWWLNGKSSHMFPQSQFVFSGPLVPPAPADMFCALGKDDQKIYVVPSQQLVVIRTGASAYGVVAALSPFDDSLWSKISRLNYKCSYTFTGNGAWNVATNWLGNRIPPQVLDKEATIIINPVPGGECILNVTQTIAAGTNLKVAANAKFRVMGNLTIQQ